MSMAHPALNGAHHASGQLDSETERVWATLPKELVKGIDDFWHANRFKSRSVAIEELIRRGLVTVSFRRPV